MQSKKLSEISIVKYSLSTYYAHIALYAQIAACAIAVMLCAPYLKHYIETTEFITSGHLDTISRIVFEYVFKFWFWGACVVVAAHIVQTGHANFSDIIRSFKYAPSFIIIQGVFFLPMLLIGQIGALVKSRSLVESWVIGVISVIFIFPLLIWQLYGQLAVPIFVIEKEGILKSIFTSLYRSHKLIWGILVINLIWSVCALAITGILCGGTYFITGATSWRWVVDTRSLAGFDIPFQYPFLALAYIYLYTQSCRNTKKA